MLNSTAAFMFTLSNLTHYLNMLAFQPDVSEHVIEFYNTCEQFQQLIAETPEHPDMDGAFRKNIPRLVKLANRCHHLSLHSMPEALTYEGFTKALLNVYSFCCNSAHQAYVPRHVKLPYASQVQESIYFEMQCTLLTQQWEKTELAALMQIAMEPLCAIATATPLNPCNFITLQEAYKHLHNLQSANTESGLLSVLYGINYNTDACKHWLLTHQQQQLGRLISADARRGYIAATIRDIKMARFNPHLKNPSQPFSTSNPSLEDCMEAFFESRFEQVARTSYHVVYTNATSNVTG